MSEEIKSKELTSPEFKQKLGSLYSYMIKYLKINQHPLTKFVNSQSNSDNPFGFTGHYDHVKKIITVYITDRHDTDILRSFAHEVIHHWQNERGTLHPEKRGDYKEDMPIDNRTKPHYAQENSWLRKREMEAYLLGNILFRDWQDEQRMGPPKLNPSLPKSLEENLMTQPRALKHEVDKFVNDLISKGVIYPYHRERTSGDMDPKDFSEDLGHKILSSISEFIQTMNNRGNWENQTYMIK